MHNSRLGCFTFTGIIAALITAVVIAVVAFTQGGVLYSPGALNAQSGEMLGGVTSHAEIGGDCKTCHVTPWGSLTMADRCTTCHVDVAAQMREVASLHGAMKSKNPRLNCAACHPDHRGADAPLTVATTADFPHEALGFSLAGHQFKVTREAFVCSDCHAQSITTFDPLDCQVCHQQMDAAFAQQHALDYGGDCLACHDGVDRFGKAFSHSQFQFPLTGKHLDVNCAQCHAGARAVDNFASAPQDCFSCHQKDDPHEGRFGTDCGSCHKPDGWKPATFDHNLAAFRLEGKHASVECEKCHQGGVFKGTPQDCYSCHRQDDKHGGKFGTDCAACHTPSDWENATFDHSRSNFPLTGAHQQVACEKCHVNAQFAGTPSACVSCHADPVFHAGAFGADCASCHNTNAWSPAVFNLSHPQPSVNEHGSGIFHGGATCRTCHPSSVSTYTCLSCHSNNQGGEGGEGGGGGGD
jgi:hypothetical protein